MRVEPSRVVTLKDERTGETYATATKPVIHLDCGHSYEGNPIFVYPLGDHTACARCKEEGLT